MSIWDVEFGTTDAETELIRSPEIFDKAFFDPENYIDELVNGYKFVISGRKGDGKSAFLAKLERLSNSDELLETIPVNLERLNSKFFERFTDEDLTGGKRYVPMWKCIILLELVKYIEKRGFSVQRENYCEIVSALTNIGLLQGETIETTITTLDETELSLSLKNWITFGKRSERETVLKGANEIYNTISSELESVYLGGSKFRMVFDGLDDILRNKEMNIEIITGLIRAANEVNRTFGKKALDFKAIILIRTDILDKCRDPDISKIKNGSRINLNWKPDVDLYSSKLGQLILARFNMSGSNYDSFRSTWNKYFPETIAGKDSLEYMLDNTLFKPRDMLMFFSIARDIIGKYDRKLSEAEFKVLLKRYSEEYFLSHMQDELTGFLPDEAIYELQSVISRVGSRRFSFDVFEDEMRRHAEFDEIDAAVVLKLLFERGYVGQFRKRPDHPKDEFLFQTHINPHEIYESSDDCMLHRGLVRAFGV